MLSVCVQDSKEAVIRRLVEDSKLEFKGHAERTTALIDSLATSKAEAELAASKVRAHLRCPCGTAAYSNRHNNVALLRYCHHTCLSQAATELLAAQQQIEILRKELRTTQRVSKSRTDRLQAQLDIAQSLALTVASARCMSLNSSTAI